MELVKKTHLVIPDTQIKPGVPIDHLYWAGMYAAKKRPDHIIHLGDHWDMPSLSSYDKGTKSFEGRTYKQDIQAGIAGMTAFLNPIRQLQAKQRANKEKVWRPKMTFLLGNHEDRISRAIELDRKLEGLVGLGDLHLQELGWHVHPYLEVVNIDGISYSHYFTSGVMGRPVTSARTLVTKKHTSCVMGHVQKAEIDFQYDARGRRLTGIFAGCFYQHDEQYLGPQTNEATWRGIWMFYNIDDGEFTLNNIPLSFLKERYGNQETDNRSSPPSI